jgi:serine/threonine protein kinase
LHRELKVAHRDLKCENVLLDRYNNIRVIDFNLSNQFSGVHPRLTTECGSPAYASPEMVKGHSYTQAIDIWSSGTFHLRSLPALCHSTTKTLRDSCRKDDVTCREIALYTAGFMISAQ